MSKQITNIAGYQFKEIASPETVCSTIQGICDQTHLLGSIFITTEGINLALAGIASDIEFILHNLDTECGFDNFLLNTSYSDEIPFSRLLVKHREMLVPTNKNISTNNDNCNYVSSELLKQWLDQGKDITLLDLRNEFEIKLGSFVNAEQLGLRHFRDLGSKIDEIDKLPKEKPVVTFCTGGIRCEKGAYFIAEQGFSEVYQLHGGILDYLKNYNDEHWQGNCFVFDDRVSLNKKLEPTFQRLCQNCQILLNEDEEIFCSTCNNVT